MNTSTTCQTVSSSPWTNAAIFAVAAGALVFVVSYAWSTRGAWRTSVMGRHVMTFMVAILAVAVLAVIGVLFGTDWPYRDQIRATAWGLIAACVWWRVVLLYRVQHSTDR